MFGSISRILPMVIAAVCLCRSAFSYLAVSPIDGTRFCTDDIRHQAIVSGTIEPLLILDGNLTACRGAEWSPDGRTIAFKWAGDLNGVRIQAPGILDVETATVTWLHPPVHLCGNPRFSTNGSVFFTVRNALHILKMAGGAYPEADRIVIGLPDYCNTIAVEPGGLHIALTNASDSLYILDSGNGSIQYISGAIGACYPQWSPDGRYLAFRTISGGLRLLGPDRQTVRRLGEAGDYCWLPDSSGLIASVPCIEGDRIIRHVIAQYPVDGTASVMLDLPEHHLFSPVVLPDRHTVLAEDPDRNLLVFFDMVSGSCRFADRLETRGNPAIVRIQPDEPEAGVTYRDDLPAVTIRGVPYQHQVYCTPAGFNGHWACNGTAAVMAIAYYGLLNNWDFVASTPFSHTSHLGRYVSDIYTYNGMTFNIASPDPNGNPGYGAYGYIVQNDWEDTKTHMKEYIQYHGLGSSVDWSPSWEELQTKTASRQPFILLSSITSSGHYKTVVGYISGQHAAYFNDPYGNKNQTYMNFNGAGVVYDWPGYNNGYSNLNTVWCYIYANGTPPADPPGTNDNPILIDSFPFTDVNSTRSSAGQDLFDYYNCASSVNETGREFVYLMPITQTGTLNVSVSCDQAVDIDIHLLSSLSASTCLARGHMSFAFTISTLGTYYITCDTFTDGNNIELMGDYTLTVNFTPDSTPVPTSTPTQTPSPTPSPTPTRTATPTPAPTSTPTSTPTDPSPQPVPASGQTGIIVLMIVTGGVLFVSGYRRR